MAKVKLKRLTKRQKRKRKGYPMATVHDRRAVLLAENSAVRVMTVDDPYELGGRISVVASIRDDPLGRMHAREQIDDAKYQAGREYQRLCELAEIIPVKAMDPTNEPVDGGGSIREPFNDAKRAAILKLQRLSRALGKEGEAICRAVLINRATFGEIAGEASDRGSNYVGRRFRECLETLAGELGLAARANRPR